MGAIGQAMVAYAQPMIDQSDGSAKGLETAMLISQLCWNLALSPPDSREQSLNEMQPKLKMNEADFDEFRRCVIAPMIQRHQEMFPQMHRRFATDHSQSFSPAGGPPKTAANTEKYPGTDRYAPCPCNSGRKYKFCCGAKGQ